MSKANEIAQRISDHKTELESLPYQISEAAQKYVSCLADDARKELDKVVREVVTANPQRTNSIGNEKLANLKSIVGHISEDMERLISTHFQKQDELLPTAFGSKPNALGTVTDNALNQSIGKVCHHLGNFGYEVTGWFNRRASQSVWTYSRHVDLSQKSKDSRAKLDLLLSQRGTLKTKISTLEQQREQAQAGDKWDSI